MRHRLVVDTLPPSAFVSRAVLAFLAASHIALGVGHLDVRYIYHPVAWSLLFFAAAIACAHAALRFHCVLGVAVAGGLTGVAYASRAGALLISSTASLAHFDWGALTIGVASWVTMTVLAGVLFVRGIGPLSGIYQRRRACH